MLKKILRFGTVSMFLLCLAWVAPGVFAQVHQDSSTHREGQRNGHRDRPYYHNGRWYRHGWLGIGVVVPALSTGVLVDSLPSSYTVVAVQGNTYYYGDNTYFRQFPNGGYAVVTAPHV